MPSPKLVPVVLTEDERADAAAEDRAGTGAAVPGRAGVRGRRDDRGGRR